MFERQPLQPASVRLFVAANVLLWGLPVPLHLALTLAAGLMVPAALRGFSRPVWLTWSGLLLYGVGAYLVGPCSDGAIKVVGTAIFLSMLLLALDWLTRAVRWDRALLSPSEVAVMLVLITVAAATEYLYRSLTSTPSGTLRVGGLYLEPSHLALSTTPLMLYLWLRGNPAHRLLVLATAGVLMVVSYSSTLLVMLILLPLLAHLGQVFQRRINPAAVIGLGVVCALPLALPFLGASEDTLLRLNDIVDLREESNLSSLVYVNGWQLLDSYLSSTSGVGLGLNAMGCSPRAYTDITEWLELINLGDQNFNDGSFILSKLGSEFGFLGVLLFLWITLQAVRLLLAAGRSRTPPVLTMSAGWLAVIGLGGFMRSGGGYFAGPVLLCLFALWLSRQRKMPEPESTPEAEAALARSAPSTDASQ